MTSLVRFPRIVAGALRYSQAMSENAFWVEWHRQYDDPESPRSRRLAAVQQQLRDAIDHAPKGRIRLISMCAGQGRDVIGVLADHPRSGEVDALLVELNPELVADAQSLADAANLSNVKIVTGDAALTNSYAEAVPAEIIMVCGVFGRPSDEDIKQIITELPHLGTQGAVAIWTKEGVGMVDRRPLVRSFFTEVGFEEITYYTEEGTTFGVGSNRWNGAPLPFRPDRQMFTFRDVGAEARG